MGFEKRERDSSSCRPIKNEPGSTVTSPAAYVARRQWIRLCHLLKICLAASHARQESNLLRHHESFFLELCKVPKMDMPLRAKTLPLVTSTPPLPRQHRRLLAAATSRNWKGEPCFSRHFCKHIGSGSHLGPGCSPRVACVHEVPPLLLPPPPLPLSAP